MINIDNNNLIFIIRIYIYKQYFKRICYVIRRNVYGFFYNCRVLCPFVYLCICSGVRGLRMSVFSDITRVTCNSVNI